MTMFERERYSVECPDGSDVAVMRGVMRLASPAAYEAVFAPVQRRLSTGQASTIDLTDVSFMNSSGIRALATLVLLANDTGAALTIVASGKIPWQKKTVASFRLISPALIVDLR
ncbi:MAG: STAS domain-containing protein [Gemmatimonadaceae bacterium]